MAQNIRKVPWKLSSRTGSPTCHVFTPPLSTVRPTRTPEQRWSGSASSKSKPNLFRTPVKSPRTRLLSLLNSSTESNILNGSLNTLNSPTLSKRKEQTNEDATFCEPQWLCDNRFLSKSEKSHESQQCATSNKSKNTTNSTLYLSPGNVSALELRHASPTFSFRTPQQYLLKKERCRKENLDKDAKKSPNSSSCLPPSTPQTFGSTSFKISRITLTPTTAVNGRGRSCTKFSESTDGVYFDTPFREELVKRGLDGLDFKPHILGRGGFGVVVLALYGGKQVAVKVITKNSRRRRSIEISIQNEENAFDLIHHPNIVETYGIYELGQNCTIVVMEFAGSVHLVKILEDQREVIDNKRRLNMTYQIATAIQWCHQHDILHLDVKPANVMVNDNDLCKLGDFGCSRRSNEINNKEEFHLLGGTVAYRAPELLQGSIPTFKADVYSFAITMWQIVSRQTPYNGLDPHVIIYKVVSCNARPECPEVVSDINTNRYRELYETLWALRDNDRLDADAVCHRLQQLRSEVF